ncbi:hypothetical protein EG832_07845, partial [bacterium]|nr:hypothetical protein [bacterium]
MKLTSLTSFVTGFLLLMIPAFAPASVSMAQSGIQPATFGNYSMTLPPGWQYDPAGSDDVFLAFNY